MDDADVDVTTGQVKALGIHAHCGVKRYVTRRDARIDIKRGAREISGQIMK